MLENNEQWLSLVDGLQRAALGEKGWDAALQGLADATGSRGSQLIGRKTDLLVLFNIMTGIGPDLQQRVIDLQPINPRPPLVERAPLLKSLADWDILRPEEAKRDRFYQEVLRPVDAPFFCATVIERQQDLFVTLGVVRSHSDGYITAEQRRVFSLLAPHVRAAMRLQTALEGKSAALLAECMETLSIPLFVCDSAARVKVFTQAAQALVSSGRGLELKNGKLRCTISSETRMLEEAVAAAASSILTPGPPAARAVAVTGPSSSRLPPMVLEVFTLPGRLDTPGFASIAPRVLIVACGQRKSSRSRRAALLQAIYRLTAAEIEVAQLLTEGISPQEIAGRRGVSVGTVRVQIKAILVKVGVRRQVELTARLNQL